MKTDTILRITGAVVALALIALAAWWWQLEDGREQAAGMVTAALGLIALVLRSPLEHRSGSGGPRPPRAPDVGVPPSAQRPRVSGRRARRDAIRPPPGIARTPEETFEALEEGRRAFGGAAALAFAVLASALASGCGAGAIGTHARAALVTTRVVATAGQTIDGARAAALDRVEAEHPTDPEHDRAVREEAARWRPVGRALDATRAALDAWVESIDLARLAGDDSLGLAELAPLAGRTLALVSRAVALARELGADASGLPEWLRTALSAVGVDVSAPAPGGAR